MQAPAGGAGIDGGFTAAALVAALGIVAGIDEALGAALAAGGAANTVVPQANSINKAHIVRKA
jgi:hypothetical protein